MWINDLITVNEEIKFGRVINDDGSVRPSRDTGFRAASQVPHVYVAPPPVQRYVAYDDQFHVDEIKDAGPAVNAVRFVTADYAAAVARNIGYIRENIANREAHEKSLLTEVV